MIKFNKQAQKGFSLLELLLVVAVGAMLILAGLAIYRNVTSQAQVNEASRLLNVLKQETQKLYQGEGIYGGGAGADMNTVLINAGAVPSAYQTNTAGQIISPFNGEVNVVSDTPATTFTITFLGVSQAACINMGRMYTANDPDFAGITVGTATETAPSITWLNTNCAANDNSMAWSFN